ncbi:hypothetical protein IWZ03DRAFT_2269 [Phyllosticta citriasiana]|uniref:Uncharacterized protein n=1 Tax=Phyllosticta citriasiana TaxID=595635 RepID=A0ABR1KWZ1_9PEZI
MQKYVAVELHDGCPEHALHAKWFRTCGQYNIFSGQVPPRLHFPGWNCSRTLPTVIQTDRFTLWGEPFPVSAVTGCIVGTALASKRRRLYGSSGMSVVSARQLRVSRWSSLPLDFLTCHATRPRTPSCMHVRFDPLSEYTWSKTIPCFDEVLCYRFSSRRGCCCSIPFHWFLGCEGGRKASRLPSLLVVAHPQLPWSLLTTR